MCCCCLALFAAEGTPEEVAAGKGRPTATWAGGQEPDYGVCGHKTWLPALLNETFDAEPANTVHVAKVRGGTQAYEMVAGIIPLNGPRSYQGIIWIVAQQYAQQMHQATSRCHLSRL